MVPFQIVQSVVPPQSTLDLRSAEACLAEKSHGFTRSQSSPVGMFVVFCFLLHVKVGFRTDLPDSDPKHDA